MHADCEGSGGTGWRALSTRPEPTQAVQGGLLGLGEMLLGVLHGEGEVAEEEAGQGGVQVDTPQSTCTPPQSTSLSHHFANFFSRGTRVFGGVSSLQSWMFGIAGLPDILSPMSETDMEKGEGNKYEGSKKSGHISLHSHGSIV